MRGKEVFTCRVAELVRGEWRLETSRNVVLLAGMCDGPLQEAAFRGKVRGMM